MVSGGDPSEHVKEELKEEQQEAFLKETWQLSRETYGDEDETIEEPADLLAAKMKAIQSLSQGESESTTFSWKDFKRAYKMMSIWEDSNRTSHTDRVRVAAKAKAVAERKAAPTKAQDELKAKMAEKAMSHAEL